MGFGDFHVKIRQQRGCNLSQNPLEYSDTQRIIAAMQHRGIGPQGTQAGELVGTVTRGAGKQGRAGAADVGFHQGKGTRVGEVQNHIGCFVHSRELIQIVQIHGADHPVAGGLGSLFDQFAHAAISNQKNVHVFLSFVFTVHEAAPLFFRASIF